MKEQNWGNLTNHNDQLPREITTQIISNREPNGWYDRPQKELVTVFQSYINTQREKLLDLCPEREYISSSEIIRRKLDLQASSPDKIEVEFFSKLRYAWDAIAYDAYEPGTSTEALAGSTLSMCYNHCRATGDDATIKLTDPLQVRIIDALAEACDVPHQSGQTDFEIDERHKHRTRWVLSKEYQDRFNQAQARKRR